MERAERAATLTFCQTTDAVLDTGGILTRLWNSTAMDVVAPRPDGASETSIARLRRALGAMEVTGDVPVRSVAERSWHVGRANEHRLQARYADLGDMVPDLIIELAHAERQATDGLDRRRVAAQMALALRAADGLAFKLGFFDLSARLIDLMAARALASEDPALMATAAYVRTEAYFATGDLDFAYHALVTAIDQIPTLHTTPGIAAAIGALHMRAAVVCARQGHADVAADHLTAGCPLATVGATARRTTLPLLHRTRPRAVRPRPLRRSLRLSASRPPNRAAAHQATPAGPPDCVGTASS